jgi:ATP-dependent RNA helicase RhlB
MDFSELDLDVNLKKSLEEAGYITAMPVQEQVIDKALDGVDVYVQSQTGTGKTAAYLLVIMQRMLSDPLLKNKKALIMVPTRELAVQVEAEAKLIGKYTPIKIASFYGGVGYSQQQNTLRNSVQIMVGTPGRVLDLNSSGYMNLMDLGFLVLDEADRMFDMGFYPDLRKLIKVIPAVEKRQTMLFSATLNAYVKNLAWEYTKDPIEIEIEPDHITVEEITQLLYHVKSEDKFKLLLGVLEHEMPETAIIFCNTKRYTEIVSRRLNINGFNNEFISGDLPQRRRLNIIDNIKTGKTRLLVATDVAARGLDIEGLDLVINYDLPTETENYVHRIGRTARAGKSGKAITLANEQDVYEISHIEKFIEMKIPSQVANAELYGEDKSKGNRRTGYRKEAVKNKDFSDSKDIEYNKHSAERNENSKNNRRRRNKKENHDNEFSNQNRIENKKLSSLSLEDRKVYYKQKYDTDKNAGKITEKEKFKKRKSKYVKNKNRLNSETNNSVQEEIKTPIKKNTLISRISQFFKNRKIKN